MINKTNNKNIAINSFYGNDIDYNFNIREMIDKFNFYDYISNINNCERNGAFLIITDQQYVLGYNSGLGEGSHNAALARAYKEINGGGKIENSEKIILTNNCYKDYITARISYEKDGKFIIFNLTEGEKNIENKKISYSQLETFKMFYDDYNNFIKSTPIEVDFHYTINKKSIGHTSSNLDELLLILNKFVDEEKEEIIDKKIIGKAKKDNNKKLIKM